MLGLFHSEWIKWRSLRNSFWLAGTAIALILVICTLLAVFISTDTFDEADGPTQLLLALGANSLSLSLLFVLLGVIGALIVTSEFSQGTIAPTFLSEPRRLRVLLTKLGFALALGTALAVAAQTLALMTSALVLTSRGIDLPSVSAIAGSLAKTSIYGLCGALFGLAIGVLLRQPVFAVVTLIVWAILIEPIAGAILAFAIPDDRGAEISRFLPITALDGLLPNSPTAPTDTFPPIVSVLVFLVWTVTIGGIGAVLVIRADVK